MTRVLNVISDADVAEAERILANHPNRIRACGECQLCCEVMAIGELDKPRNQRCAHQCEGGCGIYGAHPNECRVFHCGWRLGMLPGKMRPDRVHAVMDCHGKEPEALLFVFHVHVAHRLSWVTNGLLDYMRREYLPHGASAAFICGTERWLYGRVALPTSYIDPDMEHPDGSLTRLTDYRPDYEEVAR